MSNPVNLSQKHEQLLINLLVTHVPDTEVWAYGSRVRGDGHDMSDLDIVLRNRQDLTQPVSGITELKEALQQSTLPICVDVHDWACLPESFHNEILNQYDVIK